MCRKWKQEGENWGDYRRFIDGDRAKNREWKTITWLITEYWEKIFKKKKTLNKVNKQLSSGQKTKKKQNKTQQRWRNIRRKTGEQEQKRAEVKVRILVKEGWAEEMMKRCLQQFLSIYL